MIIKKYVKDEISNELGMFHLSDAYHSQCKAKSRTGSLTPESVQLTFIFNLAFISLANPLCRKNSTDRHSLYFLYQLY